MSEVSELEVRLGEIAEIKVKTDNEELLELAYALASEKLKIAEELKELRNYFDLEDLDEDVVENIETDVIKQLLQSYLSIKTYIRESDLAQLKEFMKVIYSLSKAGADSKTIIKLIAEKTDNPDLQYYILYYYRWCAVIGKSELEKIGIVKPYDLLLESKKKRLEKERKELARKILELYEQGLNKSEIARRLGIHRNTVSKYLKKYAKL